MVFSRQASTKFPWEPVGFILRILLVFQIPRHVGYFLQPEPTLVFKNAWKSLTFPTFTPPFTPPTQTFSET